jgi:hypothetical protein
MNIAQTSQLAQSDIDFVLVETDMVISAKDADFITPFKQLPDNILSQKTTAAGHQSVHKSCVV